MTTLQNDRFLRALLRQPVDRTPVWLMRQAGRYLPEYRATRAKAGNFLNLCKNPDLACEVTIQPLDRYPLDAAILFSDILTIPDAMGLGLYFAEGEGPNFERPIRRAADVKALGVPDPHDELKYVVDAVSTIRKALNGRVPLIGFSGSPWTLATYMVEGKGTKQFALSKGMMYEQPAVMHELLDKIAQSVTSYLNAQIAAGAQAVMLFDTWGGVLSPKHYREFSLAYMQKVIAGLTREADGRIVPVIMFTKDGCAWLEDMSEIGCDAIGLDWTCDMQSARARLQDKVALQGNLDPCVLYGQPDVIESEVAAVLESFGQVTEGAGHVFNLGHGIHPQIDPEHTKAMIEAVHRLSPAYHSA